MQRNFNLGSLSDWYSVGNGEVLRFDLPASGVRRCDFQIMSDADVSVVATTARSDDDEPESYLVGYGAGLLDIKFGIHENVTVSILGPDGCSIWIKTKLTTQVMAETGEPSFTNIEPRRMSQSERVTAMQMAMARNMERRNLVLLADIEARARALEAQIAQQSVRQTEEVIEEVQDDAS